MHKAREHQQPLYKLMCFVDFKKAFDSISHDKFWVTMMDMGYSLHLVDLLAKLYRKAHVEHWKPGVTPSILKYAPAPEFFLDIGLIC